MYPGVQSIYFQFEQIEHNNLVCLLQVWTCIACYLHNFFRPGCLKTCSKSTIKAPEHWWHCSSVFIVDFEECFFSNSWWSYLNINNNIIHLALIKKSEWHRQKLDKFVSDLDNVLLEVSFSQDNCMFRVSNKNVEPIYWYVQTLQ